MSSRPTLHRSSSDPHREPSSTEPSAPSPDKDKLKRLEHDFKHRLARASKEKDGLHLLIDQLKEKVDQLKEKNRHLVLRTTVDAFGKGKEVCRDGKECGDAAAGRMRDELEGAKKGLEESREETRRLRKALKDAEKREGEWRGKGRAFEKERQGWVVERDGWKAERETWTAERDTLLRDTTSAKAAAEQSASALLDLQTRHQAQTLELGQMVISLEYQRDTLQTDLRTAITKPPSRPTTPSGPKIQEIDFLRRENARLQAELEAVSREGSAHRRKISVPASPPPTPTHGKDDLQRQVQGLREQVGVLQAEKETVEGRCALLLSEKAQLEERMRDLRERYDGQQTEHQDAASVSKWARAELADRCTALDTAQQNLSTSLAQIADLQTQLEQSLAASAQQTAATATLEHQLSQAQDALGKQTFVMDVLETDAQEAAVEVMELQWRLTAALEELRRARVGEKGGKECEVDRKVSIRDMRLARRGPDACVEEEGKRSPVKQQDVKIPPTEKTEDVPMEDGPTDLDQALSNLTRLVCTSISRLGSAVDKGCHAAVPVVAKRESVATCPTRPLTSEMHCIIAGFLAADNALLALANYNIANRQVHQATLPALYETVVWDDNTREMDAYGIQDPDAPERSLPVCWSYVQHIFITSRHSNRLRECLARSPSWAKLDQQRQKNHLHVVFPNLRMTLLWQMRPVTLSSRRPSITTTQRYSSLRIRKPIDASVLHRLLTTIPVRYWPTGTGGEMQMGLVNEITEIFCCGSARVTSNLPIDSNFRYHNNPQRRLTISYGLPASDAGKETLRELLRIVEPAGLQAEIRDPVELYVVDIRPVLLRTLLSTYAERLRLFLPPLQIKAQLVQPERGFSVETIKAEFDHAVETFARVQTLPTPKCSSKQDKTEQPYILRFTAVADDQTRYVATFRSSADSTGRIVAELKVKTADGRRSATSSRCASPQ